MQNAIIGAFGLVLVALISGWFGTRTREREPRWERRAHQTDEQYHQQLHQQIADAEHDGALAENSRRDAETRAGAYERFLWRQGFDPAKIVTGDETDAMARTT